MFFRIFRTTEDILTQSRCSDQAIKKAGTTIARIVAIMLEGKTQKYPREIPQQQTF